MIRRHLSHLLVALIPDALRDAGVDLLGREVRAGLAREDALEAALERALADVKAAESKHFVLERIYKATARARDEAVAVCGEALTRAEKAEAELVKLAAAEQALADDLAGV